MQAFEVKKLIESSLPGSTATVETKDEVHFSAVVVAAQFAGKTKVAQQQLVYAVLNEPIRKGVIHALSLKTMIPPHPPLRGDLSLKGEV